MKGQHIDMDNYEEYFLLYVDNELTQAEKASVEQFLEQHPELRIELDMLMDTRLGNETLTFDGKDALFVNHDTVSSLNIEELQVQWLDNELDPEMAAKVEAFTSADPRAAADLEWLKKTKLPQEHIAFPDKASLYRTGKKPGALVQMPWKRMAVAAAVILAAGLFWINRESNETAPQEGLAGVVSTTPVERVRQKDEGQVAVATTTAPENRLQEKVEGGSEGTASKDPYKNTVTNTPQERTTYAAVDPVQVTTEQPVTEVITSTPVIAPPATDEATEKEAVALNVKTNYASEALNSDHGTQEEEYADEEHKQRKGLRGIVRKVNRFYNKATNPDPDKATVKVANFEIGLPR